MREKERKERKRRREFGLEKLGLGNGANSILQSQNTITNSDAVVQSSELDENSFNLVQRRGEVGGEQAGRGCALQICNPNAAASTTAIYQILNPGT